VVENIESNRFYINCILYIVCWIDVRNKIVLQLIFTTTTLKENRIKIGRNDKCPCGAKGANGKPLKYKHCCLPEQQQAALEAKKLRIQQWKEGKHDMSPETQATLAAMVSRAQMYH